MFACLKRRSYLLLVLAGVGCLLAPPLVRADWVVHQEDEYEPRELLESVDPAGATFSALVSSLFFAPPWLTVQQQVAPPPPPTVVVPTPIVPPTAPTIVIPDVTNPSNFTMTQPGEQQGYTSWNPTIPDPGVTGINQAPEPGTLLTGVLGGGLVWLYRRRQKRKNNATEDSSVAIAA